MRSFVPHTIRKRGAVGWWAAKSEVGHSRNLIYLRNCLFSQSFSTCITSIPKENTWDKMLLVFLSWHGYFPKFCFYWIMETKSWSTMIGTFGFQVFRGTPNFHSFHFLRSSKDALAHTKDASIRACLSKLSGADAQSKPVRPEDYSVLFVACSSVDAWAPVLGCSEAPEKSCCNCLSLGKWKRRHFLMVLMLNDLHSLLQPVDSDWTTHILYSIVTNITEMGFRSALRPCINFMYGRDLRSSQTTSRSAMAMISCAICSSASLPVDLPSLFWANSIWTGYELGLHLRELSPVGSRQSCGSFM